MTGANIATQIRVLAEEYTLRTGTGDPKVFLGDHEYDTLLRWCDGCWPSVRTPTAEGFRFEGREVVRSGRVRGIGFEEEK